MSLSAIRAEEACISRSTAAVPEHDPTELLIALAVFICACLYLWPLRDYVLFNADEGIILSDADRVLRGQVPYRDFASLYTPGSYLLLALAFKIFGQSLLVARSILLFFCGLVSSITYFLARRAGSRTASLFASAILAFGCLPVRFLVLHNWDCTVFALIALYSAVRFMEGRSHFWASILGFTTALTCLTEQARGAGLVFGFVIAGIAMLPIWRVKPIVLRSASATAVGFLVPFVVTLGYFASQHSILAMLRAWLFPLHGYHGDNHVPYGFVSFDVSSNFFSDAQGRVQPFFVLFGAPVFLASALAVMVIISTVYWLAWFYRSSDYTVDVRALGGCTFLGIWLSTLATSRADFHHIIYITPLFAFLLPSLLDIEDRRTRYLYAARPFIAAILLVSFAGFGVSSVLRATGPTKRLHTRRGELRASYDDEVIPYVQAHLAEGESVFVHPYQPLYSFINATVPGSRFDGILRPTPEITRMVLEDLSKNGTKVVLLERTFAEKASVVWPSIPLGALANDPVKDYIVANYHTCKVLNSNPPKAWIFDYMVRNDLRCP